MVSSKQLLMTLTINTKLFNIITASCFSASWKMGEVEVVVVAQVVVVVVVRVVVVDDVVFISLDLNLIYYLYLDQ